MEQDKKIGEDCKMRRPYDLSKHYVGEVKKMLERYEKGDYEESDEGVCNICLKRGEGMLVFHYEEEGREGKKFAHKGCLDDLNDDENRKQFLIDRASKITSVINAKLVG